jgi:hypothetical protein
MSSRNVTARGSDVRQIQRTARGLIELQLKEGEISEHSIGSQREPTHSIAVERGVRGIYGLVGRSRV